MTSTLTDEGAMDEREVRLKELRGDAVNDLVEAHTGYTGLVPVVEASPQVWRAAIVMDGGPEDLQREAFRREFIVAAERERAAWDALVNYRARRWH